ncbi:MAG: ACP S-malonyltransferase [Acidimicrobiia bacterium]|jgi:[acyl-carrier-protein] S-malonyltransferase
MRYAVLFPGQGSQFVGMGADLFDARPDLLGDRADTVLGWSLRSLCLEGPEDELTRTEHAQPALFALGFAAWQELSVRVGHPPSAAAGHSLGEYTALAAAGVISFEDGLRLVAERGLAMARAADREPSGMAALLGAGIELAEEVAVHRREQGGRLHVANDNAPGQVVVAGGAADLEWLEAHGRGLGVRRVVRLAVAGAFHSPFMEPAAEMVAKAVAETRFEPAAFPVYANVTACPASVAEIPGLLVSQVVERVRFAETVRAMTAAGIRVFVHVGPGDITAGMARRIAPDATVLVAGTIESLPATVSALSEGPEDR